MVEVYDPARLQASLELLVARANDEAASAGRRGLRLESEQVGEETYHSLRGELPFELHYAFAGGYMVVAPSRALVMKAIRTHESGETLGRSARFRALFPPDRDAHVSGLVYQNMGPTILSLLQAPGASQLSGDQRRSFEALSRERAAPRSSPSTARTTGSASPAPAAPSTSTARTWRSRCCWSARWEACLGKRTRSDPSSSWTT